MIKPIDQATGSVEDNQYFRKFHNVESAPQPIDHIQYLYASRAAKTESDQKLNPEA